MSVVKQNKRKLKPSGIDWIGDVPEGWGVERLKYACTTITDGSHFSPECVDSGYPYVTATDVRGVGIDLWSLPRHLNWDGARHAWT